MTAPLTLLLTDIVDSTALSQRLGDEAMSALWRAHDRCARDLLRKWGGREIDKSDGFLLLFERAPDALGYALDYHRALRELPVRLEARSGLHVGAGSLRSNDAGDVARGAKALEVDGLVKPLAARVMSVARGGQTLLTAAAVAALGPDPPPCRSLGTWRLKGFDDPVELFEPSADGALLPPPDGDKGQRVVRQGEVWVPLREVRNTLPAERDAFIGRRAALLHLGARIAAGTRLLTVIGVGGTGKTRLVQRFGWLALGDYPGGVWFCDLSQAHSLDGVVHGVAQGLDIALGMPDPVKQIASALAGRGACLVVLDNFEQVTRHAEQTLGVWLDRAREARFIVTSRAVLGIPGEEVYALAPLDSNDAASLFWARAEAARPDFRPSDTDRGAVDPLVRLLDGLPLAIELAAARVRVMQPQVLLQRMGARFKLLTSQGGRPDRHATLRAAFDWSWDLLCADEKSALAQLSVFEGGFTLRAAEAVLLLPAPVDVLQSLVEKSLVRQLRDARLDLLVSIQDYAREQLETAGRFEGSGPEAVVAAQRRHGRHFAGLAEADAVADACADLDNLVAACRRAVALGDPELATGALEKAWAALLMRGPFRAGMELAAAVCAMPGLPAHGLARAACVAGRAQRVCGRVDEARASFEASLRAARECGDLDVQWRVTSQLGDLHVLAGRMDEARVALNEALDLAIATRNLDAQSDVLCSLGNLFEHLGSFAEARAYYESALRIARECGNRRWEGGSLGNLGLLCANEGRMAEAREFYEGGLAIARELGDRRWEGNTLCNLGLLHQVQGRLAEARATLDEALAVARDMGYARLASVVMCNLGLVCESMQQPQQAGRHYEDALALARDLGDRRSQGQFLSYLGVWHARQGQHAEASGCLDEAQLLLSAVGDKLALALLACGRAEAAQLAGDAAGAQAALAAARELAAEVGAEAESEVGLALERVGGLVEAGGVESERVVSWTLRC